MTYFTRLELTGFVAWAKFACPNTRTENRTSHTHFTLTINKKPPSCPFHLKHVFFS